LIKHQKTGFKPSVFNAVEHKMLEENLITLKMDFKVMLNLKIGLKKKQERPSIITHCFITVSEILNQV
jgi:hypothetical protein